MKDKAEKYLNIALGGNMNIKSLTPFALIEIMSDFAKENLSIAYQAGYLENADKKSPIKYEDLIELEKEANKWVERYTKN